MPLPKGDVHKKKEIVQDVTLHDLDVANARPQVWTRACRACCKLGLQRLVEVIGSLFALLLL